MSECAPRLGEDVLAFEKPNRAVHTVFLHCSATSNESFDVYACHDYHTNTLGWSCIGYHYYMNFDGLVQYGRDSERTPAAQSGHNEGTLAICLNGLHVSDFTADQYASLRDFCEEINQAYEGEIRFRGHNEVAAKECPVFDYRAVLGLNDEGYMVDVSREYEPPPEMHQITITRATVGEKYNSRHNDVRLAQGLLHAHGEDPGTCDGIAGPMFTASMKGFQKRHGLQQTGIAAPAEWEILEDAGK